MVGIALLMVGPIGLKVWVPLCVVVHLLQVRRTLCSALTWWAPLLTVRKPLLQCLQLLIAAWVRLRVLGMLSMFRPKTLLSWEGVLVDRTPRSSW